jgi:hypothetical protein
MYSQKKKTHTVHIIKKKYINKIEKQTNRKKEKNKKKKKIQYK